MIQHWGEGWGWDKGRPQPVIPALEPESRAPAHQHHSIPSGAPSRSSHRPHTASARTQPGCPFVLRPSKGERAAGACAGTTQIPQPTVMPSEGEESKTLVPNRATPAPRSPFDFPQDERAPPANRSPQQIPSPYEGTVLKQAAGTEPRPGPSISLRPGPAFGRPLPGWRGRWPGPFWRRRPARRGRSRAGLHILSGAP